MKFLFLLVALSGFAFGASPVTSNQAYQLNRASKINADSQLGTNVRNAGQFGMKATWSYAVQGGAANSDITLLDEEGNAAKLPTGAIVTHCYIDVVSQPGSSTSSGRLAFSSKAVGDLKAAALAHTTYTTTNRIACLPDGTVGNMIKTSSELTLKMRTHSEAMTTGKINIWVEYLLSE